jgi:hypothetical protein
MSSIVASSENLEENGGQMTPLNMPKAAHQ